jgi:hypothetical protein
MKKYKSIPIIAILILTIAYLFSKWIAIADKQPNAVIVIQDKTKETNSSKIQTVAIPEYHTEKEFSKSEKDKESLTKKIDALCKEKERIYGDALRILVPDPVLFNKVIRIIAERQASYTDSNDLFQRAKTPFYNQHLELAKSIEADTDAMLNEVLSKGTANSVRALINAEQELYKIVQFDQKELLALASPLSGQQQRDLAIEFNQLRSNKTNPDAELLSEAYNEVMERKLNHSVNTSYVKELDIVDGLSKIDRKLLDRLKPTLTSGQYQYFSQKLRKSNNIFQTPTPNP